MFANWVSARLPADGHPVFEQHVTTSGPPLAAARLARPHADEHAAFARLEVVDVLPFAGAFSSRQGHESGDRGLERRDSGPAVR
jgi:hypothetical protein